MDFIIDLPFLVRGMLAAILTILTTIALHLRTIFFHTIGFAFSALMALLSFLALVVFAGFTHGNCFWLPYSISK